MAKNVDTTFSMHSTRTTCRDAHCPALKPSVSTVSDEGKQQHTMRTGCVCGGGERALSLQ
jgi:hypothetical protein